MVEMSETANILNNATPKSLIILDEIQKKRGSDFRFPVLAVAVGVYLPLGLSVPIFIGGLLAHRLKKKSQAQNESVRKQKESKGLLLASGLITGEALMGVLIAVIAAFVMQLPAFSFEPFVASTLGFAGLIAVIFYLQRSIASN